MTVGTLRQLRKCDKGAEYPCLEDKEPTDPVAVEVINPEPTDIPPGGLVIVHGAASDEDEEEENYSTTEDGEGTEY